MPIHNHEDNRVNLVADLIEHLRDYKFHIKSLEIAENVVKLMDQIYGESYGKKFKDYLDNERAFNEEVKKYE